MKIDETEGKKQVSAHISVEDYHLGRTSELTWGYLIHLGLGSRDLNFKYNALEQENERLRNAIGRLQRAILEKDVSVQ